MLIILRISCSKSLPHKPLSASSQDDSILELFRPFGRAEDECSRSAAPQGGRGGTPASVRRHKEVPSADPLRQSKSEVAHHEVKGWTEDRGAKWFW